MVTLKRNTHLTFVGDEPADESDLTSSFKKTLEDQNIHQHLLKLHFLSAQKSSNSKEMLTCMMETTLFLYPLKRNYSVFGLEALTAAFAGIPILISENAGMAKLLHDMEEDRSSVVRMGKDFDSNVTNWREHILEKISNQSKAHEEASKLRESLLKSTHIGTTHLKFLSTVTRTYFL